MRSAFRELPEEGAASRRGAFVALLVTAGGAVAAPLPTGMPDAALSADRTTAGVVTDDLTVYEEAVRTALPNALARRAAELGVSVTLGDVTFEATRELAEAFSYDVAATVAYIVDYSFADGPAPIEDEPVGPQADRDSYLASVWSGIPSGGHGYVKQKFNATVGGGKVYNPVFTSSSYQTGFTYATWSGVDSWFKRVNDRRCLEVYIQGVLTYPGPYGSSIQYEATFLDFFGTYTEHLDYGPSPNDCPYS